MKVKKELSEMMEENTNKGIEGTGVILSVNHRGNFKSALSDQNYLEYLQTIKSSKVPAVINYGASCFCQGKCLWPELLGVDGNVAAKAIESENPQIKCVVLHEQRHYRIQDFSCNRVRIWVDHNNIVLRVPQVG